MATHTHTHVWSPFNDNFIHGRELENSSRNYFIRRTTESRHHIINPITESVCNSHQNDDDNSQEIQYKFYSLLEDDWSRITANNGATYLSSGEGGGGGRWKVIGLSLFLSFCTHLVGCKGTYKNAIPTCSDVGSGDALWNDLYSLVPVFSPLTLFFIERVSEPINHSYGYTIQLRTKSRRLSCCSLNYRS